MNKFILVALATLLASGTARLQAEWKTCYNYCQSGKDVGCNWGRTADSTRVGCTCAGAVECYKGHWKWVI